MSEPSKGDTDFAPVTSEDPEDQEQLELNQVKPDTDEATILYTPRSSVSKKEPFEWWVFSPEPFKPNVQVLPREPALLESVLEYMGGFGTFQRKVTATALFVPWLATSFQSISTLFTSPLLPSSWFPDDDTAMEKQMKGMITIVYFLGWMVGCQLAGNWGDQLGRRPCFFRTAAIQLVGGLLTCLMPEYYTYLLARFVTGIGVGGFGIISWVLASEFWGSSYRNSVACIMHTPYALGLASFAIIALVFIEGLGVQEWRLLALLANAPCVFVLAFLRSETMVPESPRFLMCSGQFEKVREMMEAAAIESGRPLPEGWVLQSPAEATPRSSQEPEEATPGLLELCGTRYIRGWLWVMSFMWFATSFGYYGLIYNAEMGDKYLNSIFGALIEIPAYFACVKILQVLGRRNGCAFFLGLIGVACTLCAMVMEYPVLLLLLGLVGKFGAAGAFDGVYIFATELFPTQVRSVAMGTASTSARVGVLVAQPLIAIGQSSDAGWLPLLAFGITCGVAACMSLKLPETLNLPMWETIEQTIAAQEGTLRLEESDVSDVISDMDDQMVSMAQVRSVLGDEAVAKLSLRSDMD